MSDRASCQQSDDALRSLDFTSESLVPSSFDGSDRQSTTFFTCASSRLGSRSDDCLNDSLRLQFPEGGKSRKTSLASVSSCRHRRSLSQISSAAMSKTSAIIDEPASLDNWLDQQLYSTILYPKNVTTQRSIFPLASEKTLTNIDYQNSIPLFHAETFPRQKIEEITGNLSKELSEFSQANAFTAHALRVEEGKVYELEHKMQVLQAENIQLSTVKDKCFDMTKKVDLLNNQLTSIKNNFIMSQAQERILMDRIAILELEKKEMLSQNMALNSFIEEMKAEINTRKAENTQLRFVQAKMEASYKEALDSAIKISTKSESDVKEMTKNQAAMTGEIVELKDALQSERDALLEIHSGAIASLIVDLNSMRKSFQAKEIQLERLGFQYQQVLLDTEAGKIAHTQEVHGFKQKLLLSKEKMSQISEENTRLRENLILQTQSDEKLESIAQIEAKQTSYKQLIDGFAMQSNLLTKKYDEMALNMDIKLYDLNNLLEECSVRSSQLHRSNQNLIEQQKMSNDRILDLEKQNSTLHSENVILKDSAANREQVLQGKNSELVAMIDLKSQKTAHTQNRVSLSLDMHKKRYHALKSYSSLRLEMCSKQISNLEAELEVSQSRVQTLESLQHELETSHSIQMDNLQMKHTIEISDLNDILLALEVEFEAKKSVIFNLGEDLKSRELVIKKVESLLDRLNLSQNLINDQMLAMAQENEQLSSKLLQQSLEAKSLVSEYNDTKKLLESSIIANGELHEKIEIQKSEVAGLNQQILDTNAKFEIEMQEVRSTIQENERLISELQNNHALLEYEYFKTKDEETMLLQNLKDASEEISTLKMDVTRLEIHLVEKRESLKYALNEISQLQETISDLNVSVERLQVDENATKVLLHELHTNLAKSDEIKTQLHYKLVQTSAEYDVLNSGISQVFEKMDCTSVEEILILWTSIKRSHKDLQEEISKSYADRIKMKLNHENQLLEVKSTLQMTMAEKSGLDDLYRDASIKLTDSYSNVENLEASITKLKFEIEELRNILNDEKNTGEEIKLQLYKSLEEIQQLESVIRKQESTLFKLEKDYDLSLVENKALILKSKVVSQENQIEMERQNAEHTVDLAKLAMEFYGEYQLQNSVYQKTLRPLKQNLLMRGMHLELIRKRSKKLERSLEESKQERDQCLQKLAQTMDLLDFQLDKNDCKVLSFDKTYPVSSPHHIPWPNIKSLLGLTQIKNYSLTECHIEPPLSKDETLVEFFTEISGKSNYQNDTSLLGNGIVTVQIMQVPEMSMITGEVIDQSFANDDEINTSPNENGSSASSDNGDDMSFASNILSSHKSVRVNFLATIRESLRRCMPVNPLFIQLLNLLKDFTKLTTESKCPWNIRRLVKLVAKECESLESVLLFANLWTLNLKDRGTISKKMNVVYDLSQKSTSSSLANSIAIMHKSGSRTQADDIFKFSSKYLFRNKNELNISHKLGCTIYHLKMIKKLLVTASDAELRVGNKASTSP